MNELQSEVDRQDQDILTLQKSLKESETLLSTALYQAKQKLEQITKAQERPVSSEELIRFSHRISSTNAVAAPQNWVPGDPRRPYPTDLEMRMGFLGRLSDLPLTAQPTALLDAMHNPPGSALGNTYPYMSHSHQNNHGSGMTPDHAMASGSYVHPPHFSTSVGVDPSTRNHEDVDIMSSDSSSTSSSDSQ
jgi:mediator of RNA polymerase II transcription subunit 4